MEFQMLPQRLIRRSQADYLGAQHDGEKRHDEYKRGHDFSCHGLVSLVSSLKIASRPAPPHIVQRAPSLSILSIRLLSKSTNAPGRAPVPSQILQTLYPMISRFGFRGIRPPI